MSETPLSARLRLIALRQTAASPLPLSLQLRTIALGGGMTSSPELATLSLSSTSAQVGVAKTINIVGATSGSTITATPPDGMTLNSGARTITGPPTVAGTFSFALVETLAGATGSPKSSNVTVTIAAAAGSAFAMAQQPAANRVYQRSTNTGGGQGKGQGFITQPATVSAATPIFARCRSAADGTTIVQAAYQAIASAPVGSTPLTIPGVDARLGWFFIDLAPSATGPWQLGTIPIGMGAITFMGIAQSLGVRMFARIGNSTAITSSGGDAISPYGVCYGTWEEPGGTVPVGPVAAWAAPVDGGQYSSAGAAQYLSKMVTQLGVNHAFCGYAQGGAFMSTFIPTTTTTGNYAKTRTILQAVEGFEIFMSFIGHSDSSQGSQHVHIRSCLTDAANACAAWNHRGKNFRVVSMSIPNCSGGWGTAAQMDYVRRTTYDWVTKEATLDYTGGTSVYAQIYDMAAVDGVHPSNPGAVQLGNEFARALTSGSSTVDAALVGGVPVGVGTVRANPTFAAGKFLAQALQAGSFTLTGMDDGTHSNSGSVTTQGMWLYTTAYNAAKQMVTGISGKIQHYITATGGFDDNNGYAAVAGNTGLIPLNQWVWLSIERGWLRDDGTAAANRYYVNGVLVATSGQSPSRNAANSSYPFKSYGDGSYYLGDQFRISEATLWNRAMGTFVPTAALTGNEAGLIFYAPLNGSLVGIR